MTANSAGRSAHAPQIVRQVRDWLIAQRLFQPRVAIVLGSGLGGLADAVEHSTSISYNDIPHFPSPRAAGHDGRLAMGFLSGLPVALMQGRAHRYEGWSNADIAFPIRCLHSLGAQTLITTNAAGGLNPNFAVGDLMIIDSHINWLWDRRPQFVDSTPIPAQVPVSRITSTSYDSGLIEQAVKVAHRRGMTLRQGCYAATLGPCYETRSEYHMFRWMGADAVGMSTIPEVLAAKRLKMDVLAISVITNIASHEQIETTHAHVLESSTRAGPRLMHLIQQVLEDLAGQPD